MLSKASSGMLLLRSSSSIPDRLLISAQQYQKEGATHAEHEGHEAAQHGEEDVAPLVAEAAPRLEQDEGGHEEQPDRVQQRPVHRRKQPAGCGLALALRVCQPLRGLQDLSHICARSPACMLFVSFYFCPSVGSRHLLCVRQLLHGRISLKLCQPACLLVSIVCCVPCGG